MINEFKILGGMFGTKKIKNIPNWKDIMNNYTQIGDRNYDQNFLHEFIYNNVNNQKNINRIKTSHNSHSFIVLSFG